MSSKNKKAEPILSDSSSEDVKVTKNTKKDVKRKASVNSDNSASVNLKKKPQSKDTKKPVKKQDSDSESDKPKAKAPVKAPVKAAPKKKQDSDDESSDVPKKAAPVKKAAAKKDDSDSDSDKPKPKGKKPVAKGSDSDSEEEVKRPTTRKSSNSKQAQNNDEDEDGHKELFIKNLSWNSTEDSVREAFGELGTVVNVKLLTDKFTGKPKGIGFVEFEKRSDAKKALEGVELDGRSVQCSWSNEKKENTGFGAPQGGRGGFGGDRSFSRPQNSGSSGEGTTIFVGNLGFKTSDVQIKKFFSSCGNVTGVRIATHEDGKRKGFCHVDFDSADACQAAVKLAGQDLDGREIRVDISQPRQGGGDRGGRGGFGGRGGDRGGRGRGRGGFGGPARETYTMGSTGTKRKFSDDS